MQYTSVEHRKCRQKTWSWNLTELRIDRCLHRSDKNDKLIQLTQKIQKLKSHSNKSVTQPKAREFILKEMREPSNACMKDRSATEERQPLGRYTSSTLSTCTPTGTQLQTLFRRIWFRTWSSYIEIIQNDFLESWINPSAAKQKLRKILKAIQIN